MTDVKKPAGDDDMDWADALDEWEQKAFSSIVPPPPAASPSNAPAAEDAEGPATPRPTGEPNDSTLASRGAAAADDGEAVVESAAVSYAEIDLDDPELLEAERQGRKRPTTTPPPLPPTALKVPVAPTPRPVRIAQATEPRMSMTGALHALASFGDDEGRVSHMPMPSAKPLEADIAAVLAEHATWLASEAEAAPEPSRARVFVALSEIKAILGDRAAAQSYATKARDLAPSVGLAHRQARALADEGGMAAGDGTEVAALLAEESALKTPAGKLHAALVAADVLRLSGDGEGALLKLSRITDTGDVRGIVGRAALGLAADDYEGLQTFAERPEAKAVVAGLTSALRLRGAEVGVAGVSGSADGINDALRGARVALEGGDTLAAAKRVAALREVAGVGHGASWLAAALAASTDAGRVDAVTWLTGLAEAEDGRAARVLAARAVEADDADAAIAAIGRGGFDAADEVALSALLEIEAGAGRDIDTLPAEMGALGAALAAVDVDRGGAADDSSKEKAQRRASRIVGRAASRAAIETARLLAAKVAASDVAPAVDRLREAAPWDATAVDLELALRDGAHARVSDRLRSWATGEPARRVFEATLVAALVAERAGDVQKALLGYREAQRLDRASEAALRAAAALQGDTDLPGELGELADELGSTAGGALARLEAVILEDSVDDATRADLLERAHRAAPHLPIAAFLAERIAVRNGNVDEVLRWIDERRASNDDTTGRAVDGIREARLTQSRDAAGAAALILAAHRAHPHHLALRALYESHHAEPAAEHARYWEAEAQAMTPTARARISLEVAYAYERAGDIAGALRVTAAIGAQEAAAEARSLLHLARERAEIAGGETARLIDRVLGEAKNTTDPTTQREAYERLADIDRVGRNDPASALLWHNSILEESPGHLPSLRYLEHALVGEGRDDELEPILTAVARALPVGDGGERVAHADLAARLRARGADGDWDSTLEVAELAAKDTTPSLTSLRLLAAHARVRKDDLQLIAVSEQILDRASRPVEMAALRLRLAEAAFRQGDLSLALASLEQGTAEDPGDLVAFRLLAEIKQTRGNVVGAAEAHEALARLSLVPSHCLDAWYDAARLWSLSEDHSEQAVYALEQAAAIDLSHEDVFSRLCMLYAKRGAHDDLAALLDRRIAMAKDPDERVTLEVERARALLAAGDHAAARVAVAAALDDRPDHTTALATFAELSAAEEDWAAAEGAWVKLARLLSTPDEQRHVYERLGELYSDKAVHLSRAELAFREVLKRAPGDTRTRERLVAVYRRQQDLSRAVEMQQELIQHATTPTEKRGRVIELASLYEELGHDERKAEQVLDAARKESPTDVVLLRALAEFYARHKQTPAVNILLDRAVADARRAFAAGRFAPALFDVMKEVFSLRGREEAARIVGASLLAIEGQPASVVGAFGSALDPRIDDLLAPDVLSSGLRMLFQRAGSMLDVAVPFDLRATGAQPAGPEAAQITDVVATLARTHGLAPPTIYVSKTLGRTCLPVASEPPVLVVGEALLSAPNDLAVAFIVMRAMKLVLARASALVRTTSSDLAVLVPAWLQAVVPGWAPQGLNPTALAAAARKVAQSKAPPMTNDLVSAGLEVASQLGTRASTLGALALAWANRAALLGVGDPNAALEALAWSLGAEGGAPKDPAARAAWIGRTHEAKDLLIFSVGDAYAEARARFDLR